jgi:dipeptidase
MLFAKNSDRERNEAQVVEWVEGRSHDGPSTLRATYLTLPEAAEVHPCLISRPFWMWGAEMGANGLGVVIGNEALHANEPGPRRRALTGMDLVRLGLERGASARAAVEVMTALLERHGQGGDCGHLARFYYHNGFIVADPEEAFVLETLAREWAVQRIEGPRALSNAFSIKGRIEAMSASLRRRGEDGGWFNPEGEADLAAALIDRARDEISFGQGRQARAQTLLARAAGRLDVLALMAILRDHGEGADPLDWSPEATRRRTICMHAGPAPRRSQSVASMVSEIGATGAVHWVTASAAPCLSLFKPVFHDCPPPADVVSPTDQADPVSRFWRHERLHRRALADFPEAMGLIAPERDALEADFVQRIEAVETAEPEARRAVMAACWR